MSTSIIYILFATNLIVIFLIHVDPCDIEPSWLVSLAASNKGSYMYNYIYTYIHIYIYIYTHIR